METSIIQGIELGSFEAIAISLGQAKRENRDGKKSKFAVFTYQSTYSGRVKPVRDILWEDDLGSATFQKLMEYRVVGDDGNPVKDAKGGYIVDIDKILDKSEEATGNRAEKRIRKLYIEVPGGMIVPFKLQGERYANDVDGQPVLDKAGNRVKKSVIKVFVQVQNIIPGDDGKPVTQYVGGISPEVKGLELQERFYKELVNKTPALPAAQQNAPGEATDANDDDVF